MVESRGIEPLSEIPTYEMSSYAIDSVSAFSLRKVACDTVKSTLRAYRLGTPPPPYFVTEQGNCLCTDSLTSNAPSVQVHCFGSSRQLGGNPLCYTSSQCGMDHYNSSVVILFWLSLEAVFYLRTSHSQNPVEPIATPYLLFKVYGRDRKSRTSDLTIINRMLYLLRYIPIYDVRPKNLICS